ncbi:MAG: Endoribonuclease [Nocardioidaceae bacterium]|nr:Endoribonuclease [Nocardioidaceae bacterium]
MTSPQSRIVHLNPLPWVQTFGQDQGQLRLSPAKILTVSGIGALDENGALLHEGDISAQLSLTMHHLERILESGGMNLHDVLRMTVYSTDVDATIASYDAVSERLRAFGAAPPTTLVGVTRLAIAGMGIQIDASAGR